MKTTLRIIMIMILLPTFSFTMIQVEAHSEAFLLAWTSIAPTIDGVVDTATEWAMADKQSFTLGDDYSGYIYAMNDDTNLYLAVRITDDDFGTTTETRDSMWICFDNDHDGAGPEEGDDNLICSSTPQLSFDCSFITVGWNWDILEGGTDDGAVAATGDGLVNSFEFAHPLDSGDLAHDFSLKPGRIVGFTIAYWDNRTYAGYWPAYDLSPPSSWADIIIASPNSIYQGNLILRGNTVLIIEDRRFDINGSIFVTDNATLIVRDAMINFTQGGDDWDELCFSDPMNGRPRLIAENMTIAGHASYGVMIELWDNSSAIIDKLQCTPLYPSGLPCTGIGTRGSQVQLTMSNSGLSDFSGSGGEVEISNCNLKYSFNLHGGKGSITDSKVGHGHADGDSELIATNCTFEWGLYVSGSSNVTVYDSEFIERHYEYPAMHAYDASSITFCGNVEVNGSLQLNENATLRLEDAQVNFVQTHDEEYNVTLRNYSSLEVENATVDSSHTFIIYFYNSSTAVADEFTTPTALARVYAYDSSSLDLNSFSTRYLRIFNSSIVNLSNSSPYYLRSYDDSTFNIFNSTIEKQYSFDSSKVTVTQTDYAVDFRTYNYSTFDACDSTIEALLTYDGSICVLVNSTYNSRQILDQSEVCVWWHLDVHVTDSASQNVPLANVTVSFPNATIAESKLADIEGWTRSTLMEKMMNTTGEYPVGNYTVDAAFGIYMASESVNMTGNKQITLHALAITDITGPTGLPDGKCDMRDIGLLARNFGLTVPPAPVNCDLTGPTDGVPDGIVDMRDIGLIAQHYGERYQ